MCFTVWEIMFRLFLRIFGSSSIHKMTKSRICVWNILCVCVSACGPKTQRYNKNDCTYKISLCTPRARGVRVVNYQRGRGAKPVLTAK